MIKTNQGGFIKYSQLNTDHLKVEAWSDDIEDDCSNDLLKSLQRKITLPTLDRPNNSHKNINIQKIKPIKDQKTNRYSEIFEQKYTIKKKLQEYLQPKKQIKVTHRKIKAPLKTEQTTSPFKQKKRSLRTEYPLIKFDPNHHKRKQNNINQKKLQQLPHKIKISQSITSINKIKNSQDVRVRIKTQKCEGIKVISSRQKLSKKNQSSGLINNEKLSLYQQGQFFQNKQKFLKKKSWNRFVMSQDQPTSPPKKTKIRINHRSPSTLQSLIEKNRQKLDEQKSYHKKDLFINQVSEILKPKKTQKVNQNIQKVLNRNKVKIKESSSLKVDDFLDDHLQSNI